MEKNGKERNAEPGLTKIKEDNTDKSNDNTEVEPITKTPKKEVERLTTTEAGDKLKFWQILIIIFTVLISVGIVITFVLYIVFSIGGNFVTFELFNIEKKNTATTATQPPSSISQMSDDPFDLEIVINNTFYKLPLTVRDLEENGWLFGSENEADSIIAPGETAETYFALKDNMYLFATLKNFSDEEITRKNADIIGIKIDKDYIPADNKIIFIKNITLGTSSKKDVESVFGKCTDIFAINKGVILTYKKDEKQAKFVFDNSTGILKEVEYINDNAHENSTQTAFEQSDKGRYKQPGNLGNNPVSGVLQVDGDLYKIPISVTAFIKNGWEISFKDEKNYLLGNENAYISLEKDDIIIPDVEVYNFDNVKRDIEKCYVISVDVSSENETKILLPKNIMVGMSEDELLKAVSGMNCTIKSAEFNQYSFADGKIILTVDVDKQEDKVKYWILQYDVK